MTNSITPFNLIQVMGGLKNNRARNKSKYGKVKVIERIPNIASQRRMVRQVFSESI